jgi:hypothetical protein
MVSNYSAQLSTILLNFNFHSLRVSLFTTEPCSGLLSKPQRSDFSRKASLQITIETARASSRNLGSRTLKIILTVVSFETACGCDTFSHFCTVFPRKFFSLIKACLNFGELRIPDDSGGDDVMRWFFLIEISQRNFPMHKLSRKMRFAVEWCDDHSGRA